MTERDFAYKISALIYFNLTLNREKLKIPLRILR